MTPYLNYLLSEIRAVPTWEFPNLDLFKHWNLILKILDCGIASVGFAQTAELVQTLLTVEQREILEKYQRINTTPPHAAIVLTYPPSFDWHWEKINPPEYGSVAISAESIPTLVSKILDPDRSKHDHLRASWLLHRAFPNIPNKNSSIYRLIKTLRNHGHPKRPDPLLTLQVYTLEEITPLLQTLEPIINQPPREKS